MEEAARIHRAEPYLSSERFRAEAAAGRILPRDLEAELQGELSRLDPARELAPGLSRAACWELLLRWVVAPILTLARRCERLEAFVSGADRPSRSVSPPTGDAPPARELSPSGRAAPVLFEARRSAPEGSR